MKKSLTSRFVLIAAVTVVWAISLIPNSREFKPFFCQLAEKKVAQYKAEQAKLTKELDSYAKIGEELTTAEDALAKIDKTDSAEYKAALKVVSDIKVKAVNATRCKQEKAKYDKLVADFAKIKNTLDAEEAKELEAEKKGSKYIANPEKIITKLASRTAKQNGVQLSKYITVSDKTSNKDILNYVRWKSKKKLRMGLDIKGGVKFTIGYDKNDPALADYEGKSSIASQIRQIIANRVNTRGVVEPEIIVAGDKVEVTMPLVNQSEINGIREMLESSARLEFYAVHPKDQSLHNALMTNENVNIPGDAKVFQEVSERAGQTVYTPILLNAIPEDLKGDNVKQAGVTTDDIGRMAVSLRFDGEGAVTFAKITEKYQGKRVAIVLDGIVYSAPNINSVIRGGSAIITGNFSYTDAKNLSDIINCGNLPVDIEIQHEFFVDPTLTESAVNGGILSAVAGMILVVLFMLVYYRFGGFISIVALTLNMVFIFGTLSIFAATLTLPGIAGIVLTIGMAVDANVLIFERIREELAAGKSLAKALSAGYDRAFITIFDSNITTLFTAFILYKVGTGPIKGFAVTLSIGILASMFTALFVTRTIFTWLVNNKKLSSLNMANWIKKPEFDFLGLRNVTFIISGVLLTVSIFTFVFKGANALDIDFRSGTQVVFTCDENLERESVESYLNGLGISAKTRMQKSITSLPQVSITVSKTELKFSDEEKKAANTSKNNVVLIEKLKKKFASNKLTYASTQDTSPTVAREFTKKGLLAAFLAALVIIGYISLRFEFAYGVASVVALLHDVIIATGLFVLCGGQISLAVLAAILTVMGYSLNDTIVVFDRIREDLKLNRDKTYRDIINLSINQTWSRTMITSLTTFLVVFILFIFGGGVLSKFGLILIFGVIIGTYSSIFVASNLVSNLHNQVKGILEDGEEAPVVTYPKSKKK